MNFWAPMRSWFNPAGTKAAQTRKTESKPRPGSSKRLKTSSTNRGLLAHPFARGSGSSFADCPLCGKSFYATLLPAHAADCNGTDHAHNATGFVEASGALQALSVNLCALTAAPACVRPGAIVADLDDAASRHRYDVDAEFAAPEAVAEQQHHEEGDADAVAEQHHQIGSQCSPSSASEVDSRCCISKRIMASTSRDIFALPGELSRAILASTGANQGNAVLNRMALVGHLWHNALAPPAGACMAALTRRVTLGERDMLAVLRLRRHALGAQIVRPSWQIVGGRRSRCHRCRAGESSCWMQCHHYSGPHWLPQDHGHRADESGCWMPAYRDHKMNDACKHVKISAHHWFGTVVQLECVACAKWSYECLEKANINYSSEHLLMFAFQVHLTQIASHDVKRPSIT